MKYRTDRIETNDHGQRIGYADWIGGPTISKVEATCPDGRDRWAYVTGEPLTWFALPAYVNHGKRKARGWIGTTDGRWEFNPYAENNPSEWSANNA